VCVEDLSSIAGYIEYDMHMYIYIHIYIHIYIRIYIYIYMYRAYYMTFLNRNVRILK